MGVFAVEGFLLAMALGRARPRAVGGAVVAGRRAPLLAVANELHQTPARRGAPAHAADVLIDTASAR